MGYTSYDFSESLDRADLALDDVEGVIAAWGEHGDYAEWQGGFLLRLKDTTYAYLTGWCDTTGWGCQDGVELQRFTELPEREGLEIQDNAQWDEEPIDLNRYVHGLIEEHEAPV